MTGMSWGSMSVNAAMVEPRTLAMCCEEHLLTAPSGLRWPARVGRGRRRTHAGEEGLDAGRFERDRSRKNGRDPVTRVRHPV